MRLALIGADPQVNALLERVLDDPEHQVVWATESTALAPAVRGKIGRATIDEHWETLLAGRVADAVIIARGEPDLRAEQLRKLSQSGVPLIVSHPAHPSMLVCYEIDMIRQESGGAVAPLTLVSDSSGYMRLLFAHGKGVLGNLEQVVIERQLADRSPESVRARFAYDMDLARPFTSDLTRLSAMAPTSEPAGYANLGVQLSGPANVLTRWSVAAVETAPGAKWTLAGPRGRAVLILPDEGTARLDVQWETGNDTYEFQPADGAEAAMTRLQHELSDGNRASRWPLACRAVELADSIQRSLEKGRTVELHQEDYTEDNTFKGAMTSLGCGLLWGSLLVLVIGVVLAGFGLGFAEYWPQLVLVVLGFFLLLQFLRLAIPPKKHTVAADPPAHPDTLQTSDTKQ
ncbi:MAG: hypothetical protein K1X71_04885 [Pirellulales bacterium]|nr:hypothetical protein [Pirellulales bacterium]